MITDVINEDVFKTPHKHIAFAINTEGSNDGGFAGQVTSRFVPELANTGGVQLGEIKTASAKGKTFHGLVCHSLSKGWENAPKIITECLDKIEIPDNEPIAIVLMGAGMIGTLSGADPRANVKAIHASKKNCILYSLEYSKVAVEEAIKN